MPETKNSETKQVEEKLIVKERIKEIKEIKEKPEKIEHKEKPEKFEVKEKPEKTEHKEKPEKAEHKEKPEKHEFKEKEFKVEALEKQVLEQLPTTDPGGPIEQRVAALEQTVNHFITSAQRPDLSRGALAAEHDTKK